MTDCLIVGGGVIGLTLAYELAGQGLSVRVIDASQPGKEASWAGAGILPPACPHSDDPLEQLTAISNELHRRFNGELHAATEIDNGYRRTGALYVGRDDQQIEQLEGLAALAAVRNIHCERLTDAQLARVEPALRLTGSAGRAYLVNDECQIRNPRHLKALLVACAARGVEITACESAEDFEIRGDRVRAVRTTRGTIAADRVCVTTGAWTGSLARKLGIAPEIRPLRGQMALLALARPLVSRIVNEGNRYLVPRADGRLLVGSTEEEAGFDRSTTAGGIGGLLQFAVGLVPALADAPLERSWAGLRPATLDGKPYLGRVGGLENAFVAAGHYRGGLQLSTGTALVMRQLMLGQRTEVDLSAFALARIASNHAQERLAVERARRTPPAAAPHQNV